MAVNQDAEQENLWNKILSEASRSVNDRLDTKTVLVLGKMILLSIKNIIRTTILRAFIIIYAHIFLNIRFAMLFNTIFCE